MRSKTHRASNSGVQEHLGACTATHHSWRNVCAHWVARGDSAEKLPYAKVKFEYLLSKQAWQADAVTLLLAVLNYGRRA
jgi:hypothetical protein